MNATGTQTPTTATGLPACERYVVKTASSVCEVRARTIAPIAEVLGFEAEMELAAEGLVDPAALEGWDVDGGIVAELLESRMIAPPRIRRRRQRTVSSRAVFFGTLDR
jgi:hypothetical protein